MELTADNTIHDCTINTQLKVLIECYLQKHPHISLFALSKKMSIGDATLRRVMNGSLKSEPEPNTVLNIVSILYREKNIKKLTKIINDPIKSYLESAFSHFIIEDHFSNDEVAYLPELNQILKDFDYYLIYKLAANKPGTDRIKINELLGHWGNKKVNELIQFGYIQENHLGELHACNKVFAIDPAIALMHASELIRFFKLSQVDLGRNLFFSLSESLNEAGIATIKKIQKEALNQIHNIMKNASYQGEIPYFCLNILETLELNQKGTIQ
ncbi:MAG: hypothetical protein U0T83_03895 [Bacteriovoracaceae bacterium]